MPWRVWKRLLFVLLQSIDVDNRSLFMNNGYSLKYFFLHIAQINKSVSLFCLLDGLPLAGQWKDLPSASGIPVWWEAVPRKDSLAIEIFHYCPIFYTEDRNHPCQNTALSRYCGVSRKKDTMHLHRDPFGMCPGWSPSDHLYCVSYPFSPLCSISWRSRKYRLT